jgi:DNA-binding transcriptional LysR family regulator
MYVTPAAIHTRLKQLEEKLGVPLYEMNGHALRLTQASEIVLPHIRSLLLNYGAIFSSLREWQGTETGRVRIATGSTFSSYLLPSLLRAFRDQFPEVELVVETGKSRILLESLENGTIDVTMTLTSRLLENPAFRVEAVWDFEFVLVTSGDQPYGPCSLKELVDVPFILRQRGGGARVGDIIDTYLAQAGFQPNVVMRFDHPETTKAMIRAGLGISILPIWAVEDELKSGTLSRIQQEEPPLIARMALITRRDGHSPRAVTAFVQMAKRWRWDSERRSEDSPS